MRFSIVHLALCLSVARALPFLGNINGDVAKRHEDTESELEYPVISAAVAKRAVKKTPKVTVPKVSSKKPSTTKPAATAATPKPSKASSSKKAATASASKPAGTTKPATGTVTTKPSKASSSKSGSASASATGAACDPKNKAACGGKKSACVAALDKYSISKGKGAIKLAKADNKTPKKKQLVLKNFDAAKAEAAKKQAAKKPEEAQESLEKRAAAPASKTIQEMDGIGFASQTLTATHIMGCVAAFIHVQSPTGGLIVGSHMSPTRSESTAANLADRANSLGTPYAAMVVVPDSTTGRTMGQNVANAIFARTGIQPQVEYYDYLNNAADPNRYFEFTGTVGYSGVQQVLR